MKSGISAKRSATTRAKAGADSTDAPKRRRGRPRRLELDAIIDAAREIGLDKLEMQDLAARLGVAPATLYGYVSSREELVRLAAFRNFSGGDIEDCGQTWQQVVREMAERSFVSFTRDRHLLIEVAKGAFPADIVDAYRNSVVAKLVDRGLSPERAYDLFVEANEIVAGAAMTKLYVDANAGETKALASAGRYMRAIERMIADYEGGFAHSQKGD